MERWTALVAIAAAAILLESAALAKQDNNDLLTAAIAQKSLIDASAIAFGKSTRDAERLLTAGQRAQLMSFGKEYARSGDEKRLLTRWQKYVSLNPLRPDQVSGLVAVILEAALSQASVDLDSKISTMQKESGSDELANFDLRRVKQKQERLIEELSSLQKKLHDQALAVIQKL